jgi:hypothetical protein
MGGMGSGRSPSLGLLTDKCEDYRSIDLAWLRRRGSLTPGYFGRVTWSRGGSVTASIGYRVEYNGLRLFYRHQRHGEDWQDVNELVPFVTTGTNFNGQRRWFECLSCRRPCRILYGGGRFRCRRCYRLKYESQYEPGFARAASRAHKIRERLGESGSLDDPFPPKPKSMHWKTYNRLQAEYERRQGLWTYGIMGWLQRHQ